ncbi:MAG: response regulator [Kangiellaceae bacterium]|jgi:two-component system response regulator RegA|nr:response regulator [Kangiellaceae bacterium]
MSERWLVIDDDTVFTDILSRRLERQGYQVTAVNDSFTALATVKKQQYDKCVLDLKLDDESGLSILPELLTIQPTLRVLVLTGYASINTAVNAIKLGAFNYLAKPSTSDQIITALSSDSVTTEVEIKPLSADEAEWEHLQKTLADNQGNISATARALNMHRRTLQRKLAKKRYTK